MNKLTVGECFYQIRNGANIKQGIADGGFPITRIETIANNKFNRDRMGYAGITDTNKYQSYILEDGDLLMSHINSVQYLGRVVLYHKQGNEKIIHGMNLLNMKANRDLLNPAYAKYYFRSTAFREQIRQITKKSVNQASFTVSDLKKLPMQIPSLSEQYDVVKTLDKVTELLGFYHRQLLKLDILIKSRFLEEFGDPVFNSMGWPLKRFDEICQNLDSKRKPITASNRMAGIYPYYGASGIVDHVSDYIFDEDILLVSEDGANLLMRSTPIAFSVSGKVWVNNHAHVVRFEKRSLQKYIEIYFSLIDISEQITGSAQPKLNQAKLNAMKFGIPNANLINQYYTFWMKVDKAKGYLQKSLDEVQLLFDSLIQQYFG